MTTTSPTTITVGSDREAQLAILARLGSDSMHPASDLDLIRCDQTGEWDHDRCARVWTHRDLPGLVIEVDDEA